MPPAKPPIPNRVPLHFRALRLAGLTRLEAAEEVLAEPGMAERLDRDARSLVSAMDADPRTTIRKNNCKYPGWLIDEYSELRRRGLTGIQAAEILKIRHRYERSAKTIASSLNGRAKTDACRPPTRPGYLHMAAADPRPGSPGAQAIGCKCPRWDNHLGGGWLGCPPDRDGMVLFLVATGCPIHDNPNAPKESRCPKTRPAPTQPSSRAPRPQPAR